VLSKQLQEKVRHQCGSALFAFTTELQMHLAICIAPLLQMFNQQRQVIVTSNRAAAGMFCTMMLYGTAAALVMS
jgi:hypothetical protein